MATHDCPLLVIRCHAIHQSRSRLASTVQLLIAYIFLFAVKLAAGETGFVHRNAVYTIMSALSFTAVAFREISSIAALMKLLLHIEIHVAVCELQATYRLTIAGLLLQNYVIQVSLLRGVWNSGAGPAGVHRGAAIDFGKQQ